MDVLSGITSTVVLIAALFYIRDKVREEMAASMNRRIERFFARYDKQVQALHQSVEPKVDLWWSQTGKQTALKALREKAPEFLVQTMPESLQDSLFEPILESVRSEALGLAVHLVGEEAHSHLLDELSNLIGKARAKQHVAKLQEKIGTHMDEHRLSLVEAGINLDEFERQFSTSSR